MVRLEAIEHDCADTKEALRTIQRLRPRITARNARRDAMLLRYHTRAPALTSFVESQARAAHVQVAESQDRPPTPAADAFTERAVSIRLRAVGIDALADFMDRIETRSSPWRSRRCESAGAWRGEPLRRRRHGHRYLGSEPRGQPRLEARQRGLHRLSAARCAVKERLLAMRPLLLRVIGYPLFFLLCFVVFLYITFPYDRLKEVVVAQAEAPPSPPRASTLPRNIGAHHREPRAHVLPWPEGEGGDRSVPPVVARRDARPSCTSTRRSFTLFAARPAPPPRQRELRHRGPRRRDRGISELVSSPPRPPRTRRLRRRQRLRPGAAAAGTPSGLRSFEMKITDVNAAEMGPLVQAVGLPLGGTLNGTIDSRCPTDRSHSRRVRRHDGLALRRRRRPRAVSDPHFGGVTIDQIRAGDFTLPT